MSELKEVTVALGESQESKTPTEEDTTVYKLYVIYSEQPLDDIRSWLLSFADDPKDIGIMRIDNIRSEDGKYKESNRTMICLHPKIYEELCANGYDKHNSEYDFRINPYEIREGNHPPKDCSYALYIRLPLDVLSIELCKQQITEHLKLLQVARIANGTDYTVHYPTSTRESKVSTYLGYCVIAFNHKLDKDTCAMIKVILDQTKWWDVEGKPHLRRVSWCKKSTLMEIKGKRPTKSTITGFKRSVILHKDGRK